MDYSLSIGFAQSGDDLTSIAKLRYRVFHEQFGANGKSFYHFKKSEWESYDENCEHIVCKAIFPNRSEEIIGTFRCKISTIRDEKFRVQKEFNIDELLKQNQRICELGRICVDARFRNGIIIFKIWQFLFNFLKENDVEILIGVASFEGSNIKLHEESLHILFKNHVSLLTSKIKTEQENKLKFFQDIRYDKIVGIKNIPDLLKAYLRFGSYVSPCYFIDFDFNTVDICCVLILKDIPEQQKLLFSRSLVS